MFLNIQVQGYLLIDVQIFYFLKTFPIYDRMLKDFDSAMPYTEIFPVGQPFKSLYAVHSLRQYIAGEAKKVSRRVFQTRLY